MYSGGKTWYNICMKIAYELTIEQSQKLVMTPDLIQAIRILQYSNLELEEYVQEELLTNPVMELVNDRIRPYSFPYSSNLAKRADEEDLAEFMKERYQAEKKETLTEHLIFQLETSDISSCIKEAGRYIIDALDDNGYLTMDIEEIAACLKMDLKKVEKALTIIQTFDPLGVGARKLEECLLIQLDEIMCEAGLTCEDISLLEDYRVADEIIRHHLEDLGDNRLALIGKSLGIEIEKVQEIGDIIRTLEPRPGRAFDNGEEIRYIVPDLKVEKSEGCYKVSLIDDNSPQLMVSSYYKSLQKEMAADKELADYLNKKLNSAIWLIRSIEQRKETILKVADAVVKYQQEFFEEGPKKLRTLTLKQIAEEVDIHESTVSRSTNGKYIDSPLGVFELKYFFKSGVSRCACQGKGEEEGAEVGGISSMGVKSFISELIEEEDPKFPLSDQEMACRLKDKGIDISRRTIAKYRDEMGILSSSKRRRY